ncbi:MAG TPA: hypothetical protein DHV16_08315 [Nitrospiraceae bacterium]|nr:MAG: hypothetical protein A2Z82_07545 [Nitrospirae bacterium GWA2_46_11]OGW24944.1 MAG: hypothetical protein A2X55_08320 [Nitrospirae bacterium GWB2_47_37]HAK88236.1 hypothetical protein [Nitrospiraceae bacterium]HCZ12238.1 hypothetical protein [Nitrospiraceae bacterium]
MKVLIVEDNEKNLKLFKLLVTSTGCEVVTAANGEEGIKAAREEKPVLIVMDIQMPVMDGISAMGLLKSDEATRDIPVVALTSYAMKGDRERFLREGFADYIAKPIDTDVFLDTIKTIIGKHHGKQ